MKNTGRNAKVWGLNVIAVVFMLTAAASLGVSEIVPALATEKDQYTCHDPVVFRGQIALDNCEQLSDAKIRIFNTQSSVICKLPTTYGNYFSTEDCNLYVNVDETNRFGCHAYGGSNTINYEIVWNIPASFKAGVTKANLVASAASGTSSDETQFSISCQPTTTVTTTSTSSTTCPCCTTTTTCPGCVTTTTKPSPHRSSGGGGSSTGRPVNTARPVSSCTDGIKNYLESDIDCGGTCPPCDNEKACGKNADCKSGNCANGVCKQVSCEDGIFNNGETDVDCGGDVCDPCMDGKNCEINEDCVSGDCKNGICYSEKVTTTTLMCAVPSCINGLKDQDETDVDCGGSCIQCEDNRRCATDADCKNNYCYNGICKTPTCGDGIKNQGEKAVDCGGPCKACAPTGLIGLATAIAGDLGNLLIILIILILLGLLLLYASRKRKTVATSEFLESIESDDDLEKFVNKKKPHVVASTSRKIRRLKKFIDEGKIDIIWIKDWDYVNDLISKGLDDNNAESTALARQLKASLYTKNADVKKAAEESGLKVYEHI